MLYINFLNYLVEINKIIACNFFILPFLLLKNINIFNYVFIIISFFLLLILFFVLFRVENNINEEIEDKIILENFRENETLVREDQKVIKNYFLLLSDLLYSVGFFFSIPIFVIFSSEIFSLYMTKILPYYASFAIVSALFILVLIINNLSDEFEYMLLFLMIIILVLISLLFFTAATKSIAYIFESNNIQYYYFFSHITILFFGLINIVSSIFHRNNDSKVENEGALIKNRRYDFSWLVFFFSVLFYILFFIFIVKKIPINFFLEKVNICAVLIFSFPMYTKLVHLITILIFILSFCTIYKKNILFVRLLQNNYQLYFNKKAEISEILVVLIVLLLILFTIKFITRISIFINLSTLFISISFLLRIFLVIQKFDLEKNLIIEYVGFIVAFLLAIISLFTLIFI